MPSLDQDSLKLLDELSVGDPVIVEYRMSGGWKHLFAKGSYAGADVNSIGARCIAVTGVRDSRVRVPMDHIVSIKRA